MKSLLVLIFLPVACVGQTVEIETAVFNRAVAEKKWDASEMQERGKVWKQARDNYPAIPFDTVTKKVLFEKVILFDGISKVQAFKRCKEWAAFQFNKLDAVLEYEDSESGKLILEGYVEIPYVNTFKNAWGNQKALSSSVDMYFSLMVTLVEGKAKVSFHNLRFRYFIQGYALGNLYVPSEYFYASFESLFPVLESDFATWSGKFDLIRNSIKELNATVPHLERYINKMSADYRF